MYSVVHVKGLQQECGIISSVLAMAIPPSPLAHSHKYVCCHGKSTQLVIPFICARKIGIRFSKKLHFQFESISCNPARRVIHPQDMITRYHTDDDNDERWWWQRRWVPIYNDNNVIWYQAAINCQWPTLNHSLQFNPCCAKISFR